MARSSQFSPENMAKYPNPQFILIGFVGLSSSLNSIFDSIYLKQVESNWTADLCFLLPTGLNKGEGFHRQLELAECSIKSAMEERATLDRYHHFHGHSGMCA
jgi:hypothetical protein